MKLLNVPLGLLFNFHEVKLVDGTSRLLLPGANKPGTEGNKGNEEGEPGSQRRRDKASKYHWCFRRIHSTVRASCIPPHPIDQPNVQSEFVKLVFAQAPTRHSRNRI
jgi:hypothetical protein